MISKVALVQIVLHQQDFAKRTLHVPCAPNDTVESLKSKLMQKIGSSMETREHMNVIFCGKSLPDEMNVADLMLSPQTSLTVTLNYPQHPKLQNMKVNSFQEENDAETNSSSDECDCSWVKIGTNTTRKSSAEDLAEIGREQHGDDHQLFDALTAYQPNEQTIIDEHTNKFSSFYVFCKFCQQAKQAKLRAYCRTCHSSAIIFKDREPQGWPDVLDTNNLRVNCQDCDEEKAVYFRFKCLACNEIAIPLMQLKRIPLSCGRIEQQCQPMNCVICHERPIECCVCLGCVHVTCVPCFIAYAEQLLHSMCLEYNSQIGYTISCPVYSCKAQVSDVHTFYLMGIDGYNKYQRMAAEMYFAQHVTARQYCPVPGCDAAFFIDESDEEEKMFYCPECSRMFCRICRSLDQCRCLDEPQFEDENTELIRRISKPCPKCAVPTERSGGCAHMHCTQCQNEWCFICHNEWTDNCQWDHWFD